MKDPEATLREVFADRAAAVPPPTGVYAAVRRRHARRRRAIVAAAVAVVLVAVGVPAVLLADRGPAPTARTLGCPVSYPDTTPAPDVPGLPDQREARGSLGGDGALVRAALRTGWAALLPDGTTPRLDPATARVHLVERVDDQVVGVLTAADARRTRIARAYVVGADADHLRGQDAGGASAAHPFDGPFTDGDVLVDAVTVCDIEHGLVIAPPGSSGELSWSPAVAADGKPESATAPLPLRADGTAVFRAPANGAVEVWHGGDSTRAVLPTGLAPWEPEADVVYRAAVAAPRAGGADPGTVAAIVSGQSDWLPVPQTDLRVLWAGETPNGVTVAVAVTTLPSGARYVWAGSALGDDASQDDWSGFLPAGALDRTVLTWRPRDRPGSPLVVVATRGTVAELRPGGRVALAGGGAVVLDGARYDRVTVTGPAGPIGSQVPGKGLIDVVF